MLQLFSKKKFLVDLLVDMVDIHNHILPGIDDGAQTVAESMALIQGMQDIGIAQFIATPHIMHNYYPNTPATIGEAHTRLMRSKPTASIRYAAEHMLDDNFDKLLDTAEVLPLYNDYLLVEMSYLQPPVHLHETLDHIKDKGYYPILAHPERYLFLHKSPQKYQQLKDKGLFFQLNLLSLGGYYGAPTQKKAFKLLQQGLYDFVGTDIHKISQVQEMKAIKITTKIEEALTPVIQKTNASFY